MKNAIKSEKRKNEILDIAENLFIEKGYELTTINDILLATGIAKGSLYYHFKSKEDVLDGIIKRRGVQYVEAADAIAKASELNALQKLLHVMLTLGPKDERQKKLTEDLEKSSNGQMFLKSLTDIILRLAPVVRDIIEQGISEGVMSTDFPLETAEILLSAAHALFDNGDLSWTPEEKTRKLTAFIMVTERMLGAAEGSLLALVRQFLEGGNI